jgi:hypothetical protein
MVSPFSTTAPVSEQASRRHARRRRRERDHRIVLGVVLASAAFAALAPAAPTGLRFADAVWCAALGGATSWAASRSRRWAGLWCAGVAAAFSLGSWWAVFGIAALAIGMASAFLDARARVLGAVIGGLAAQALLRLPAQGFFGMPSVLAAIAVVPLMASAYERSGVVVRRRIRWICFVVGGLVVLASAGLAAAAAMSHHDLEDAVSSSQSGLSLIRDGQQTEAAIRLSQASEDFDHAHQQLTAFWTWPARLVPVVAQHRTALVSASSSGGDIARAGSVAAATAPYQQLKAANGTVDLVTVRSMQQPVKATADSLLNAQRSLRATRSSWLLEPVAHPLATFSDDVDGALPEAILARDALDDAPTLLGATQDRHYLILFTNPAESRFVGGFTGSYGLLTAHQGHVSFTVGNRISQLFPGDKGKDLKLDIPGATEFARRYDQFDPQQDFQNLTVSPDMPTDAALTRSLYQQYYGVSLDGVFVVDPYALASLLKLTGPVSVEGLATPLTSANAARYLIHDQYLDYGDSHDDRKDVLSAAGKATFKALTTRHLPGPRDVGAALGPVVREKRLLFYPFSPSLQPLFARVGTLGRFSLDPNSDYLSLRSANSNANKIDWYLTRSVAYDASYDPGTGNVEATVTISLHNASPAGGLPEYMIGNLHDPSYGGTVPVGTNTLYLSYYTPLNLTSSSLDGVAAGINSQGELGANVYSQFVTLPPGGSAVMVLHLEGAVASGSSYRLQVLGQPLVNDDHLQVRVSSSSPAWHPHTASGLTISGDAATLSTTLTTDRRLSVTFGG